MYKKTIKTKLIQYLIESELQSEKIISNIKDKLISEDNFMYDSYEQFVDNQEIGDCQTIVNFIKQDFPLVEKVFGEIEVDEPYYDDNGDEQKMMTHHWIEINGKIYDFSKGTLENHINWSDKYNPCVDDDEWRYNYL